LFGLFVAAEPPVNADVSVAEPESDIGLEGKEERVNYGREPPHYQTLFPEKPRTPDIRHLRTD
jgi:hypothetical protein